MGTIADKSGWVEDGALGVAVRELGGALQVKGITEPGHHKIESAIEAVYGPGGPWPLSAPDLELSAPDLECGAVQIDPAHRFAFARALGLREAVQA